MWYIKGLGECTPILCIEHDKLQYIQILNCITFVQFFVNLHDALEEYINELLKIRN